MDDVLITSYTENKHLDHIEQVFKHFCKFKMKLKLDKCKFKWMKECNKVFRTAKETLMRDPVLYHPDPNTPWITETDASKTAFTGVLLQPYVHDEIKQVVPVTFISYNFTGTQQAWSATECELYVIYIAICKLSYMIKGCKVTVRTDHKPVLEIVTGTAKAQNTVAADKF